MQVETDRACDPRRAAGKGMPRFALPDSDMAAVVAFIHDQKTKAEAQVGKRRGVEAADLQTGQCRGGEGLFQRGGEVRVMPLAHGDLAGVAKRFEGLKLEERMLYPKGRQGEGHGDAGFGRDCFRGTRVSRRVCDRPARQRAALPVLAGEQGEFSIDAPAEAHADLLAKIYRRRYSQPDGLSRNAALGTL